MRQRYEILYKNNEFLQEFIGRELWMEQKENGEQKITGKALNHSRTYADIMHRILREHWKNCDVPVSPHKVLIWSTDKNCKITQLSASHMIYDNKRKVVFSDIINQTLGLILAHGIYLGANAGIVINNTSGVAANCNTTSGTTMWITNNLFKFRLGIGTRAGNLRTVFDIQTPCATAPENNYLFAAGDGAFNTTSGLVTQGLSFSSGAAESYTEVGTYKPFTISGGATFDFIWAYDIIGFSAILGQVVNIASSIQL